MEKIIIGFEGNHVTNVKDTYRQIEGVKKYKLCISDESGKLLTWDTFDDRRNKYTLLQTILYDRKLRVDRQIFMVDRPPFCVFTIDNDRIIRLEYYQGHDGLELVYDIREYELYNQEMEAYMTIDSCAYDSSSERRYEELESKSPEAFKLLNELFKLIHDEQINVHCKKYQARLSITFDEHRKYLSKRFEYVKHYMED